MHGPNNMGMGNNGRNLDNAYFKTKSSRALNQVNRPLN